MPRGVEVPPPRHAAELERHLREARLQARVEHANVCRVCEVGESAGRPYIAMELLEGERLDQAAAGMSRAEKVDVVRQGALGGGGPHRSGLIHRDLKPGNILVQRRGAAPEPGWHAWVLDFGLAREHDTLGHTESGLAVGTPQYMSPE